MRVTQFYQNGRFHCFVFLSYKTLIIAYLSMPANTYKKKKTSCDASVFISVAVHSKSGWWICLYKCCNLQRTCPTLFSPSRCPLSFLVLFIPLSQPVIIPTSKRTTQTSLLKDEIVLAGWRFLPVLQCAFLKAQSQSGCTECAAEIGQPRQQQKKATWHPAKNLDS